MYDARMGSEPGPVNQPDLQVQHMAAIGQFERELDSLMYPVTKEGLMAATKNLLIGTFDYSPVEAETRVTILDTERDIPQEHELEHDQEALAEILKLGLFDKIPEEYIILHGREEFDKWIGPFLRSVLQGHIEESESVEHVLGCAGERFCPTKIITCFVDDRLRGSFARIHEDDAKNEGYISHTDDLIHMNVVIVKELKSLGVYDEIGAKNLLEDYHFWLDSLDDFVLIYDQSHFD